MSASIAVSRRRVATLRSTTDADCPAPWATRLRMESTPTTRSATTSASYVAGFDELLREVVASKMRYRDVGGIEGLSGVIANWLVGMAAFLAPSSRWGGMGSSFGWRGSNGVTSVNAVR